ncbi:ABC transporter substrate-binding protein [uncultured Cohaesibacter sp.]|uniref:ABC transporter substrate-binding protein n=1 Tax=uncultured Cohaesibacter sp. TaxID=1002546 RepID=UPI0029C9095E|nr:ABC transporter substrate-binding protein [uncultured Cohaesibacter sp.]
MTLFKKSLLVAAAIGAIAMAAPSQAQTFKYAFQGDLGSMDPYSLNETFTLGFQGNFYDALTAYDENLKLIPALATSWENPEPNKWIFHLREGVKFHNGNAFTADDVIFSWKRAQTDGSDLRGRAGQIASMTKIDDYTIEATTGQPNAVLMQDLTFLYIMDKEWSEENNTLEATSPSDTNTNNYANLHENGTGPFMVVERQPDVKTKLVRFDGYWKDIKSNVKEIEFTPIKQAATRVAALISGEMDLVYPVPVQDWQRLDEAKGVAPLTGPEARTIFLGMDQERDELLYSNIKGKNPFKDQKVRSAFAHALNLDAIKQKIMRGASTSAGTLIAPQINGYNAEIAKPYTYDPKLSKQLLTEAGYPDGFEVGMDCPNDRYVNDEKTCQAVASMLAKVGIKVDLNAQPKAKYFAKILATGGFDTSFYLLGWTPGSIDAHNAILNLLHSVDKDAQQGMFNLGHYSNARVDELTGEIGKETDPAKRQAMIDEAFQIVKDAVGYLPLHQQPLSWGVRDGVSVVQRADNVLDFRNIVVPE